MITRIKEGISAHPRLRNCITWIGRLIVGSTFLYSGFVKGIDPWGSLYKFSEYLAIFGFDFGHNIVLAGVFLLCIYESLCGICLLTGAFRRSAPILTSLMMLVMLPLTFWIMISDPVNDCGCFGDALIISNEATFYKNVVISVFLVWLIPYNRMARPLVTPYLQWIEAASSAIYILIIGAIGYLYQPLIDFRQYKTGTPITDFSDSGVETPSYIFVYEKDGKRLEFSEDDELPDEAEGWTFIGRKEVKTDAHDESVKGATEKNLTLWSLDGDEDVTHEVLTDEGDMIILFMPDLKKVSIASTWIINSLKDRAATLDIPMIAVVSGSLNDIAEWEDLSLADYPIYTADDTQIKEVVRGNPGVVYLSDGNIKWKSTLRSLPADDFMTDEENGNPADFKSNDREILGIITMIYAGIIALLIALSYSGRFFFRIQHPIKKGRMFRKSPAEPVAPENQSKPSGD